MDRIRRLIGTVIARFANRRFVFALAVVSLLASKTVHIDAHLGALSANDLIKWGPSFFFQDTFLILLIRALLFAQGPWLALLGTTISSSLVLITLSLASINISFFAVAGNELHWRNVTVAGDSSSWATLLTGLFSLGVTFFAIFIASWLLQDLCFAISTVALDMIKLPLVLVYSRVSGSKRPYASFRYDNVPQSDAENASDYRYVENGLDASHENKRAFSLHRHNTFSSLLVNILVAACIIAQLVSYVARPDQTSLIFMSWTLPLVPFMDFAHAAPNLSNIITNYSQSIELGNATALAPPIEFDWLPHNVKLRGFEDWQQGKEHYNAETDPLKLSNLKEPVIASLATKLNLVPIRNILLIKLESTRKDVFPIRKDDYIWSKLQKSFSNNSLPEVAQQRLATLTPNANFITGDYNDGFEHAGEARRGGINVNNCHTTGTYTLKSIPGTLCGITPLLADMNQEYHSHVYQPCLAHIFDAFNALNHSQDLNRDGFKPYKWNSMFMQSVTNSYDKQDKLMPALGYQGDKFLSSENLRAADAKFGKTEIKDINYYGMPEYVIKEYIKDTFTSAKEKNERVFLSHLTSTAHHPFALPDDETVVSLTDDSNLQDLSAYVNAAGFVDRWLGEILGILEETGAINETLIIYVGDHGLSIAENGAVTPYYQPNIGNFHVPLVFSHPALPPVDVNDVVNSNMILPTILDLLIETGSLGDTDTKAARDLVKNYEGQSLIRPLRKQSEDGKIGGWQFTAMNPGRATVSVRDMRHADWRVVVPIVADIEWRFTDTRDDKHEDKSTLDFGYPTFVQKVRDTHGEDAALWVEEAVAVARWWADDNIRRWRYGAV